MLYTVLPQSAYLVCRSVALRRPGRHHPHCCIAPRRQSWPPCWLLSNSSVACTFRMLTLAYRYERRWLHQEDYRGCYVPHRILYWQHQ